MFDTSWVADLDGATACEAVTATQERLREQEWRELALAAHWAVLHDPDSRTPALPAAETVPPTAAETAAEAAAEAAEAAVSAGGVAGGAYRVAAGQANRWSAGGCGERSVPAGAEGTGRIAEFGCAELAMLMGTGFLTASCLVRDAVDLQHRHPLLWRALGEGRGRVWKARQVARMVHAAQLSREQARFVDTATTDYIDSLPWSAFTRLVEAKIIEADPAAAETRREAAAMARFVSTGRSTEHGLKTLIARAGAGEVIYFVAVCDRIAQILRLQGDPDSIDVRRSKALAILANPARALALLTRHATTDPHPDDPHPDDPHPDDPHPDDPDPDPDPPDPDPGADDPDPEDLEPGTAPEHTAPDPDHDGEAPGSDQRSAADQNRPDRPGRPGQPDAAGAAPCPACGRAGSGAGLGAGLGAGVGAGGIDPEKLRPRAVLYVRISEQALRARAGVVNCESGIGVLTVPGLRDLLGHHHVTVRPVLDLRDQVPVDAYEVPHQMREALRLARPTSIYPWSRAETHTADYDHTTAYLPLHNGGPPGQTQIANLAPITRLGHRVKTHGTGWRHHQPTPGTYLWRTPHGYWFRVDNDGTHPLGKNPDLS